MNLKLTIELLCKKYLYKAQEKALITEYLSDFNSFQQRLEATKDSLVKETKVDIDSIIQ